VLERGRARTHQKLTFGMHIAKTNVPLFLRNKRARKAERRGLRRAKTARAAAEAKKAMDIAFGRRSKIVAMFAEAATEIPKKYRQVAFGLPGSFSVMDAPEQTLAALSALAHAMLFEGLARVHLDFGRLARYDLGANALLDVLVDELTTQAKRSRRRIRWEGNFPKDAAHARFVRALGVIKRLKITHEYPSTTEQEKLELFDERCKHYIVTVRPREADRKTKVTAKFADHIDRCLENIGMELTPPARGKLCNYVSEILDNVREHAGMYDWSIQGYLDMQQPTPMCEITIFNFGTPIAATFDRLPPEHFTRRQIEKYMERHTKKQFFSQSWRKEDLYTLMSLQGGVSSKNQSEAETRGHGSGDLIDFFQQMYAECSNGETSSARMVLISGSTYILFDGKYKMVTNSEGRRIIAFNDANDLMQRPDSSYVRRLQGVAFPGTLVSLKFPLSVEKGRSLQPQEAQHESE
jgi:hypothetical protein